MISNEKVIKELMRLAYGMSVANAAGEAMEL